MDNRGYQVEPGKDQPLSAVQLQAIQKAASERVRSVLTDIELRKWCISEAAKYATGDVIAAARSIHEFLTGAVADSLTDVSNDRAD